MRDYFSKIKKIIYNNQIGKYGLYDDVDSHEIDQIILSNRSLINYLKTNRNESYGSRIINHNAQRGGTIDSLGTAIDELEQKSREHKEIIEKIFSDAKIIDQREMYERIKSVGSDAIALIKFLGDLTEKSGTKKAELENIQKQIADIVVELSKYLDGEAK